MNQATDGGQGGGAATTQTPPPTDPAKTEGDPLSATLDEMYKDEPATPPAKVEDKPTQEATKDEKKPDGETTPSLTGYGDEPAQAADGDGKTPEKKEEKPAEEGKIEFDATDLDEANKTFVESFAKEHKLSKEATQAFANQVKAQNKVIAEVADTFNKLQSEKIAATRKAWSDELKNDPNFGGPNFKQSLKRVDVVLDKLFPNAKIYLQNSKEQLHPSAMKDLLKFYDTVLGGDAKIVNPESGVKSEGFDLDDFYK